MGIKREDIDGYDYGDLMTIKAFRSAIDCGLFTDDDGFCEIIIEGMDGINGVLKGVFYVPSQFHKIPKETKYIVWYNR